MALATTHATNSKREFSILAISLELLESPAARKRFSIQIGITILSPKLGIGMAETLLSFEAILRFTFLLTVKSLSNLCFLLIYSLNILKSPLSKTLYNQI
jgi:hypothetical protein